MVLMVLSYIQNSIKYCKIINSKNLFLIDFGLWNISVQNKTDSTIWDDNNGQTFYFSIISCQIKVEQIIDKLSTSEVLTSFSFPSPSSVPLSNFFSDVRKSYLTNIH